MDFFAEDILGLVSDKGEDALNFPGLQDLSFGQICFDFVPSGMVDAFSSLSLKRLTLREYPGILDLLSYITQPERRMHLESLELTCGENICDEERTISPTVSRFLQSFSGLQSLYGSLYDSGIDWDELVGSVCSHSDTLKRVVIHAR